MEKVKIKPVKLGLALSALGTYLCGVSGVASVSGTHSQLVTSTVYIGFLIGGAGVFITALFTNGSSDSPKPPIPPKP